METKTEHKTRNTLPKCGMCGAPATHGVQDSEEIVPPIGEPWRQFNEQPERRGCTNHPVVAMVHYLDGRIIRSVDAVGERYRGEKRDADKQG